MQRLNFYCFSFDTVELTPSEQLINDSNTSFIPSYETKSIPIPTPEFNVFFVFYHLFYHFAKGGIGLRQLCDLARMLHVLHDQMDLSFLKRQLQDYELMQQWQVFGYILVHWIGLQKEEFPFYKNTKEQSEAVLAVIMEEGNFGFFSEKRERKLTSYLGRKWESLLIGTKRCMRLMHLFPCWMLNYYIVFVIRGMEQTFVDIYKQEKK